MSVELTEDQLKELMAVVPYPKATRVRGSVGRPLETPFDRIANGIYYKLRTGVPWRELPSEYGSYNSIYCYWYKWVRAGAGRRVRQIMKLN